MSQFMTDKCAMCGVDFDEDSHAIYIGKVCLVSVINHWQSEEEKKSLEHTCRVNHIGSKHTRVCVHEKCYNEKIVPLLRFK